MVRQISKTMFITMLAGWLLCGCGIRTTFIGRTDVRYAANGDAGAESAGSAPATYDPNRDFMLIEKTFDSAVPENRSSTMSLSSSQVSDEILMTSDYAAEVITKNQVTRPVVTDSFKQGTKGSTVSETFSQVSSKSGPLDILIVMDNSWSMAEEQNNIATKLQDLLSSLGQADWRIAVVTTDPNDGCQRALIKKGDVDALTAFSRALRPGITGSTNEQGILMAVVGLQAAFPVGVTGGTCSPSAAWLRPDAPVAVLIVSDEDNCSSTGSGCGMSAWNKDQYLYDYLAQIRRPGVDAKVYGIIDHPTLTRQDCPTGVFHGNQYANIIQSTGGLWGSVCATDYGAILQRISQDAATLLKDQYILQNIPDLASAKVTINGAASQSGWTINGGTLTFTTVPPAAAAITVSYTVGARPIKSRFKLAAIPALDTLRVLENGASVASSRYSIDPVTNELVYAAAENADVRLEYRQKAPDLVTVFNLGQGVQPGSVQVSVDGATVKNFTISQDSKTLTFNAPPSDAAQIVIALKRFKSKRLDYVYNLPTGTVDGQYTVKNQTSAADVPVTWSSGKLLIADKDHVEGQKLVVTYRLLKPADGWELPLGLVPDQGTIKVKVGEKACAPSSYTVSGQKLILHCDTSGVDKITVSYVHTGPSLQDADVSEVAGKADVQESVWINNELATRGVDYDLSGSRIKFLKSHPKSSKIKIAMKYLKD